MFIRMQLHCIRYITHAIPTHYITTCFCNNKLFHCVNPLNTNTIYCNCITAQSNARTIHSKLPCCTSIHQHFTSVTLHYQNNLQYHTSTTCLSPKTLTTVPIRYCDNSLQWQFATSQFAGEGSCSVLIMQWRALSRSRMTAMVWL
jgi:hypothetical protein